MADIDIKLYEEVLKLHNKDLELANTIKQVTELLMQLTDQVALQAQRIRDLEASQQMGDTRHQQRSF